MTFTFAHNNVNVSTWTGAWPSRAQRPRARGSPPDRRQGRELLIVYLGDGRSAHRLEPTWLRD